MSVKLMSEVWGCDLAHAQQAIMLALADHADDDGSKVFPSIGRISWKTGYSERQVQRIMRGLQAGGILVLVRGPGRSRATEYRIELSTVPRKPEYVAAVKGDILTPIETLKGDISDIKGDILTQKGDITVSPEPSLQPSLQPSSEKPSSPAGETTVVGDENFPRRKKPQRSIDLGELERYFAAETNIRPPERGTNAQRKAAARRWWEPLAVLYNLTDRDIGRAKALVKKSVQAMRADRLTVSAPQSIEQVAISMYAEQGGQKVIRL